MAAASAILLSPLGPVAEGVGPAAEAESGVADVAWFESILTAERIDGDARRGAASRLLALDRTDARRALEKAIASDSPAVRAAILEAMHESRTWPTLLIEVVEDDLQLIAFDATATVPTRAAAAAALGNFRRLSSLQALARLIGEPTEPQPIVDAATAALAQLTGQTFGNNVRRWTEWLASNADRAEEELFPPTSEALAARLEVAVARRRAAEQDLEAVQARLLSTLSEMLLQMSADQRQERISRLLSDPIPAVRGLALAQVERTLGSAEVPTEVVQVALVKTLSDPVTAHRVRALKLLESIGRPDLPDRLAERFAIEQEPELLAAALAIFRRSPVPSTLDRMIALLSDTRTVAATSDDRIDDAAARAICTLVERGQVDASTVATLRDQIGPPVREFLSAPVISAAPGVAPGNQGGADNVSNGHGGRLGMTRLFGLIADDADLAFLERQLAPPDNEHSSLPASLRRAAADALRHRGRIEPLLRAQHDDAVYPALVRALADEPVTLRRIATLVSLAPGASDAADGLRSTEWYTSVRAALTRLPITELLAADEMLSRISAWSSRSRLDALARVRDAPAGALPDADRALLVERAAEAAIECGQPRDALRLLETLGSPGGEGVPDLRFRALALSGQYQEAAALTFAPARWIALLEWAAVTVPAAAPPLLDEILRRFGNGAPVLTDGGTATSTDRTGGLNEGELGRIQQVARDLALDRQIGPAGPMDQGAESSGETRQSTDAPAGRVGDPPLGGGGATGSARGAAATDTAP